MSEALRRWAESLGNWHVPRWQELPQIELYMDQVLAFLETQLSPLLLPGEKFITADMVNNYVKQGLLPKPQKKKYGRRHLARLIVITLGKQALSLTDIKTAFEFALWEQEAQDVYNAFCECQEASLMAAGATILAAADEKILLQQLATTATASGLASKRVLSGWNAATHTKIK